jgi:hypothetical protein
MQKFVLGQIPEKKRTLLESDSYAGLEPVCSRNEIFFWKMVLVCIRNNSVNE